MSVHVTSAVWKHSEAKGSKLLLLLSLADFANDEGICWPSQASLSERVRMSRRQVARLVAELVRDGELVVVRPARRHSPPVYRVEVRGDNLSPLAVPGVTNRAHRGDIAVSPEPSREPSRTPLPRPRPKDDLWEALLAVCGIDGDQLTSTARGSCNRAVKELREAHALPHEIPVRAAEYRRRFPHAALTPSALAKHWPSLNGARPVEESKREKLLRLEQRVLAEREARERGAA